MIITDIERKRGVWTESNGRTLKSRSLKCSFRIGISQENKLGAWEQFPMILDLIVVQGDAADSVRLFRRGRKLGLLESDKAWSGAMKKKVAGI
jgi:hypothetical protein